jgi:hypothetical protein
MIHETLVLDHEYTVLSLPPMSAWALLFAGKDVENCSDSTSRRGHFLIHASGESMPLRESQTRRVELCFLSGLALAALPTIFPRRTILGSVEILDCVQDARSKWAVSGKWHWVLRDPRPLLTPIEEIESELLFWPWTNERKSAASGDGRRAPSRSGIVPAIRAPSVERESPVSAARKRSLK